MTVKTRISRLEKRALPKNAIPWTRQIIYLPEGLTKEEVQTFKAKQVPKGDKPLMIYVIPACYRRSQESIR